MEREKQKKLEKERLEKEKEEAKKAKELAEKEAIKEINQGKSETGSPHLPGRSRFVSVNAIFFID